VLISAALRAALDEQMIERPDRCSSLIDTGGTVRQQG